MYYISSIHPIPITKYYISSIQSYSNNQVSSIQTPITKYRKSKTLIMMKPYNIIQTELCLTRYLNMNKNLGKVTGV